MAPSIRVPRFSDVAAVYRVCFETGPDVRDRASRRPTPELIGHVYAGPYLAFAPEWCRVVVDRQGVAGYLLAVPSTAAFESWAEAEWWPPLRADTPADAPDLSPADQAVARLLAAPPLSPPEVVAEHPAHLHVDLLERVRGQGFARTMIEDLCARLAAEGVPGVHLGVSPGNANAVGLYAHLGLEELSRGDGVIWMGRRLAA
ncbi:GNAT family N-acetyltransferase [uncultured Amnibacterium sp.]|uniref:GNAT family N-acetyltransferase n=1 Tax=uncultured Amnibacterium sp. TaxID=1631851 RepID=UPI0035CB58EA